MDDVENFANLQFQLTCSSDQAALVTAILAAWMGEFQESAPEDVALIKDLSFKRTR